MSIKQTHTIRLLNKSYTIKCPEGEGDNLQLAAQLLNSYMLKDKNQYKNIDNQQALLLASLKLSHELITSQAKQEARQEQLTQFITSLERKISQAGLNETENTEQNSYD